MTTELHNISEQNITIRALTETKTTCVAESRWRGFPLLWFTLFRPNDVKLVPLPNDEGEFDKHEKHCILPIVETTQALKNLKASRDFIRKFTAAGDLGLDHLDHAIDDWPTLKKPYIAFLILVDATVIVGKEDKMYVDQFKRMLSQGSGSSKLLREFVGYHPSHLPYPVGQIFQASPKRYSEKRKYNSLALNMYWKHTAS